MIEVVAIVGPTAVGKSALADRVASSLGSEVVSADAMQIYRGMDIGTAKTPACERSVPLRMIDVVDPDFSYSAALYQTDAREIIDSLIAAGKLPVVCGGTGLYVRAALDEMDFPSGDIEGGDRSMYTELAHEVGPEGLHDLLRSRDPRSADVIHPNNVRRVIRALEMHDRGVCYADQKSRFSEPVPRYSCAYFGLTMDRERLYKRINERVDAMFKVGLVEEVRTLVSRGFSDALTATQAIGYKEIIDALDGRCSMEEAAETIKMRSRRYAKRQLSWFKRDARICWIDLDEVTLEEAEHMVLDRIGEAHA